MGLSPHAIFASGKFQEYKQAREFAAPLPVEFHHAAHTCKQRHVITMSQNSNNNKSKIVSSVSLMAFARAKGPKMQVGEFTNSDTSDRFKSCIFTDNGGKITFVAFSRNLGELTPRQIVEQKNELQVVELETEGYENHHFALCKQRQNNWKDVDLGL